MAEAEDALQAFREQVARQREPLPREHDTATLVIHERDLTWYQPKGTNPSHLAPVLGLPMRSFEMFLQEMPPAGSSDMQQHHHEAVHVVLSGHGWSEIGDGRYEWSAGDFVSVPPMMWHRHYNGSDTESVRMLLVENSKLLEGLGLNYRASAGLVTGDELRAARATGP